jgi:hypothetical protein
MGWNLFDAFRGRALDPDPVTPPPLFVRADSLPLAGLVAAHIALFWRVLFTSDMFFFRDVFSYSYPHARFIREICLAGQLPYWNPTLNFGEPVLANPNFLCFYPSTLLLVLLPLDLGYTLHYILHFALAGVGTYALARRWNQSRFAAFFAGIVFSFSGPVLSLGNLYNHAAAAAWIPWTLLLADMALRSPSRRPWVWLTCVFGLQFLAAEPFTLFATFVLCLAYAFCLSGSQKLFSMANFQILAAFGIVGVLMLALSAVALLPSLSLLANSRRGVEGLPFLEVTSWSFHPLQLLDVIIPGFFGSATDSRTLWSSVLSNRNLPYFLSVFVGYIPVVLAFLGLFLRPGSREKFAGASGSLLLLLAFGRFTPLFALVYLVFPPLGMVRFPVKLLVPTMLFVALLAGRGADVMRSGDTIDTRSCKRILHGIALLLAAVIVAWVISMAASQGITIPAEWILRHTYAMFTRLPTDHLTEEETRIALQYLVRMLQLHLPGLAGFLLGTGLWLWARGQRLPWAHRATPAIMVFGMAQMAWVNASANPTVPRSFYDFTPPVLAHFDSAGKPYRYAYVFREAATGRAAADTQGFLNFDSIPEARGLPASAQLPFRDRMTLARASMLTSAEGVINIDVERSFPMALYDFWVFAHKQVGSVARRACLLGRMNVRYQVMKERDDGAGREVAEIFNGSPQPHVLYELPCYLPRVFAAGRAEVAATASDALRPLSDPTFDARGTIFIPPDAGPPHPAESPGIAGEVVILRSSPREVQMRATMTRPGYVVLLDRFDPNWQAAVDGQPVTILRANHLMRAVRAPEGTHQIRFTYEPRGLKSGLVISLTAIILLALVYFRR